MKRLILALAAAAAVVGPLAIATEASAQRRYDDGRYDRYDDRRYDSRRGDRWDDRRDRRIATLPTRTARPRPVACDDVRTMPRSGLIPAPTVAKTPAFERLQRAFPPRWPQPRRNRDPSPR